MMAMDQISFDLNFSSSVQLELLHKIHYNKIWLTLKFYIQNFKFYQIQKEFIFFGDKNIKPFHKKCLSTPFNLVAKHSFPVKSTNVFFSLHPPSLPNPRTAQKCIAGSVFNTLVRI